MRDVRGPRSSLFEALETAVAAQKKPLSIIIISTQAPTDSDLLSVLIDDALAGHDPRVTLSLFTAPREFDPFDEATIRLANPAFDTSSTGPRYWRWPRTRVAFPRVRRPTRIWF